MAAYVIVDIEITDPARYEEYKKMAAPTVFAFGGKYLVRGGKIEAIEGDWRPTRLVILEFPTVERAKEWMGSEMYRPAKAVRQASTKTKMILLEGLEVQPT